MRSVRSVHQLLEMKALDTIKRIKSQLDVDDVVEEVDGLKKKKIRGGNILCRHTTPATVVASPTISHI
jgi:hypothetical protein